MDMVPLKSLIYLSSSHKLPHYLQGLRGVRWNFMKSSEDLKKFFMSEKWDVSVVVRVEALSVRTVQAFLSWTRVRPQLSFIFIAPKIEKGVHQLVLSNPSILALYESEGGRIGDLVTRRLNGREVKSRKQERVRLQAEVMIKKSAVANRSPNGRAVQFLGEGCMQDFSKGGAQITLPGGGMSAKDFVSLMYRNREGQWVSVESQVRWVLSTGQGDQIIGVQFLAMSA